MRSSDEIMMCSSEVIAVLKYARVKSFAAQAHCRLDLLSDRGPSSPS